MSVRYSFADYAPRGLRIPEIRPEPHPFPLGFFVLLTIKFLKLRFTIFRGRSSPFTRLNRIEVDKILGFKNSKKAWRRLDLQFDNYTQNSTEKPSKIKKTINFKHL
jgi:hypothetical protein